MEYFLILLNQNYLSLNGDQCYIFDGNTTDEIMDRCASVNGYLPKYTELVMPQGDQGTLFDTLATLDIERELAELDGLYDLSLQNKPDATSVAAPLSLQWIDFGFGLCEHKDIDNWEGTHEESWAFWRKWIDL